MVSNHAVNMTKLCSLLKLAQGPSWSLGFTTFYAISAYHH